MDIATIVRLVVFLVVLVVVLKIVITKFRESRRCSALVNQVPGPTIFSLLLGNIPLEIIQYIGSDFHQVKDLYYSKYVLNNVQGPRPF